MPTSHQPLGIFARGAAAGTTGKAGGRRQPAARRSGRPSWGCRRSAPPQYQAPPAPLPPAQLRSATAATGRARPGCMAPVGGRRRRAPVAASWWLGLLVASVFVLYNFFYRPGKLAIDVVPPDAVVRLDGEVLKGPPYVSRSRPGFYNLSFRKEGYSKYEQTVEIEAGESERIRVPPGALGRHRLRADQRSARAAGLAGRRSRSPAATRPDRRRAPTSRRPGCRPAATCWRSRATRGSRSGGTSFTRSPGASWSSRRRWSRSGLGIGELDQRQHPATDRCRAQAPPGRRRRRPPPRPRRRPPAPRRPARRQRAPASTTPPPGAEAAARQHPQAAPRHAAAPRPCVARPPSRPRRRWRHAPPRRRPPRGRSPAAARSPSAPSPGPRSGSTGATPGS